MIKIEQVNIAIASERARRPNIRITSPTFRQGFAGGLQEGYAGELSGVPLTDEEICETLAGLFSEGDVEHPTLTEEQLHGVGGLIGLIFARW